VGFLKTSHGLISYQAKVFEEALQPSVLCFGRGVKNG
jgi:hypothetical protein